MTLLKEIPSTRPVASDDLNHVVCCDTSLCHLDVTGHRWVPPNAKDCVVCLELEEDPGHCDNPECPLREET